MWYRAVIAEKGKGYCAYMLRVYVVRPTLHAKAQNQILGKVTGFAPDSRGLSIPFD